MLAEEKITLTMFKREIGQHEARVFNNIAICYGKDNISQNVIKYCTKMIDNARFIDEVSILWRAYLRRGLVYE